MIQLMLSLNLVFNIVKEKTTTDLLKVLSNIYEKLLDKTIRDISSKVN